jgi:hypothetical protein
VEHHRVIRDVDEGCTCSKMIDKMRT